MKKGFVTKSCCDGWSKVVQFCFSGLSSFISCETCRFSMSVDF